MSYHFRKYKNVHNNIVNEKDRLVQSKAVEKKSRKAQNRILKRTFR